jgi:hypothetical protein
MCVYIFWIVTNQLLNDYIRISEQFAEKIKVAFLHELKLLYFRYMIKQPHYVMDKLFDCLPFFFAQFIKTALKNKI